MLYCVVFVALLPFACVIVNVCVVCELLCAVVLFGVCVFVCLCARLCLIECYVKSTM